MNNYDVKRLALVLAIQAEIEAMKADNKDREFNKHTMAYNAQDFEYMAIQLRELVNKPDEQL